MEKYFRSYGSYKKNCIAFGLIPLRYSQYIEFTRYCLAIIEHFGKDYVLQVVQEALIEDIYFADNYIRDYSIYKSNCKEVGLIPLRYNKYLDIIRFSIAIIGQNGKGRVLKTFQDALELTPNV